MPNNEILALKHPIMAMSMSPDGTLLAFDRMQDANGTTAIALFDLQKRQLTPLGPATRQAIVFISFSPNGKRLFVGIRTDYQGHNSIAQIWNVENPSAPMLEKVFPTQGTTAVMANLDTILVERADDQNHVSHNLITPSQERQFSTPNRSFAVAMKAGGAIVALQEQCRGNVDLWEAISKPSFLGSLDPEPGPISKGTFSPSGEILALGQGDFRCRLQLWDVSSPRKARKLIERDGHDGHISSLAFSQDMRRLASGSYDRQILVWDISNPVKTDLLHILDGHEHTVTNLAFALNGKCLISSSIDGTIRAWPISVS